MLKKLFVAAIALSISVNALAAGVKFEFGPFVGKGTSTDASEVRYVSGFRSTLAKEVFRSKLVGVSPVLSFENSFFNTHNRSNGGTSISDYDHRTFAAGIEVLSPATLSGKAFDLFLRATAGRSYSKIGIDESSPSSFSQRLIHGVRGQYSAYELGSAMPVQEDFVVGVSILASMNRLDQSDTTGSEERELTTKDEGLTLTSRRLDTGDTGILPEVVQKTLGIAISGSIKF
jgi:hypothetical protein